MEESLGKLSSAAVRAKVEAYQRKMQKRSDYTYERRLNVVQMMANGLTLSQAAKELCLTARTLENDMMKFRREMNCTTLSHLVAECFRKNLIK